MKAFVIACILLLTIGILVGIHSFTMIHLAEDIDLQCKEITTLAQKEKWDDVTEGIDKARSIWDKKRFWVALTVSTKNIEEIEIALTQSRAYAELHQKPDFFGEFIMFQKLVEHIPHQEGFHIEEVL